MRDKDKPRGFSRRTRWRLTWTQYKAVVIGLIALSSLTIAAAVLFAFWKPATNEHDAFLLATIESIAMVQSETRVIAMVLITLPDGSKTTVSARGFAASLSLEEGLCVERRAFEDGHYRYSRAPRENCVED